jgi:predicted O-linked N-acetylglucosamine transferase (SPINDLY family)
LRYLPCVIESSPSPSAQPGVSDTLRRGEALLAAGQPADAIIAAREALALHPASVPARLLLGLALLFCERSAEAASELADVLRREPRQLLARCALVRALLLQGRPDEALAVARDPALLDAGREFGGALGDFAAADAQRQRTDLLRSRAQRHPQDYASVLALAEALHGQGALGEALHWSGRALALRPQARAPRAVLATALIDRGDVEPGLARYRELLREADADTAARHLVLMHYDPRQDNENLYAAHRDFAQRHLPRFGPAFVPRRAPAADGTLRIGWLSPRFADGPVATFLTGLLEAFDRTRHRHLLIALRPGDAGAAPLRALADEWIDAGGLDDAALLQRLRDLDLDVLVDLAGHSTWNRMRVLAQRAAPLQVCWLDWFDTTGVPAMDAWIGDAWLTPEGSGQRYTERLLRLPAGRFCYTPPRPSPPPDHAGDGRVRFASFNRLAKLNDGVVAAWADILHRVPQAQLELGTRLLDDAATREHTLARFAAHGIASGRLQLHSRRPYAELLDAYRRIDVALDPFPFSGCTTTCDALWMGTAAVTLSGETFVSRQSASLLQRLGREDWIARDRADYVERAVGLAAQVVALRADRPALRASVQERLCDAPAQARDFAAALRELVRERRTEG